MKTNIVICLVFLLLHRIKSQNCGERKVNIASRIINGFPSEAGDWPWHAAIYHREISTPDEKYRCGGTIISKVAVLTAGHCLFDGDKKIVDERISVQVGRYKLSGIDKTIQHHKVYISILHEEYDFFELHNDIAILKLATEITFDAHVQPACLRPTDNYLVGERGTVIGWGLTQNNKLGEVLTQATMPVNLNDDCIRREPYYKNILMNNTFCAGDQNGTSVCKGDSGGGMFFRINDRWTLKGIVSTGGKTNPGSRNSRTPENCAPNVDVVFTDVNKYLDWLSKNSIAIEKDQSPDKRFLLNRAECGRTDVSDKPIGEKVYTNFPWVVQVMFYASDEHYQMDKKSYSCTGVLISEKYVVTISYYVFRDLAKKRILVKLGGFNTDNVEKCKNNIFKCPTYQEISVDSIVTHPGYDEESKSHDLSLLKLAKPADLSNIEKVNTICVPIDDALKNEKPSSYVQTNWWEFNEDHSTVSTALPVKFTNRVDCNLYHNYTKYAGFSNKFCTSKDKCTELIGGSLVQVHKEHKLKNRYFLYGLLIATFDRCEISDIALDFTKYVDWILAKMEF